MDKIIPKISTVQMCFTSYMADLIADTHQKALETAQRMLDNKETFVLVILPGKTQCIPVCQHTAYLSLDRFEFATSPLINISTGSRLKIYIGQNGKLVPVTRGQAFDFIRTKETARIAAESAAFLQARQQSDCSVAA